MKVTSTIDSNNISVFIYGSVDSITSHSLGEELARLPIENAGSVILDLEKVEYISSAGFRELLVAATRFENGKIKLLNMNGAIRELFDITGFSNLFDIISKEKEGTDYSVYSFKEFLKEKVRHSESTIILDDGAAQWTWKDLDRASDFIAEQLILLGAKKGSHIAICGINTLNWTATFFAVHKIGALAILVNPLLKASEIGFLSHAGDIDILCHGAGPWLTGDPSAFLNEITDPSRSTIRVLFDISSPVPDHYEGPSPIVKNFLDSVVTRNDDPCVMIFTSGSTGVPKGVLLSSYNMLTAARCGKDHIVPDETDVMCLVLPMFHIFGLVASLFVGLISDIRTVLPPKIKPDIVLETVRKHRCTLLFSVPTLLLGMASSPLFSQETVKSLRQSVIGGAPVSEPQMVYLRKQFPNVTFYIVYGLSEMSPVSFTKKNDTVEKITRTVGSPIDLIKVKIQNVETGEECATGQVGEILIKGTFLMSGYYKTPIEKQDMDADGWFHTGDLGSVDEDGYIHFAGRKKELIIRGGENIFPGEIAETASAYPGIRGVQVIGLPDDYYGEIVGCAVVLKPDADFSETDFRKYLKRTLAPHKVPSHIMVCPAFPLLANGKVDVLSLKKGMMERIGK